MNIGTKVAELFKFSMNMGGLPETATLEKEKSKYENRETITNLLAQVREKIEHTDKTKRQALHKFFSGLPYRMKARNGPDDDIMRYAQFYFRVLNYGGDIGLLSRHERDDLTSELGRAIGNYMGK